MMDEQRQKLVELMQELNIPMSHKEVEDTVIHFSDDEVKDMILMYSDVADYETSLEDFVRENDPGEYERLVTKRDEELKKKEADFDYQLEKTQEEEDIQLDSLDIKEEREIEDVVKPMEEVADEAEKVADEEEKKVEQVNPVNQGN